MKVIYFTTAQVVFITAKIAFIFTVLTKDRNNSDESLA